MPSAQFQQWLPKLGFVACCLLPMGCGQQSPLPLAPVSGSVRFQQRPLTHGRVVFSPQAGTPGPQAVGEIGPDGTFSMRTTGFEGAAIGSHIVTVICRRPATAIEEQNLVITELLIPAQYAREHDSPLRFEVQDGTNACPLELE